MKVGLAPPRTHPVAEPLPGARGGDRVQASESRGSSGHAPAHHSPCPRIELQQTQSQKCLRAACHL